MGRVSKTGGGLGRTFGSSCCEGDLEVNKTGET